jgi:Holliday junction resolvasome RuvABC endonuclease subunit
MKKDKKKTGAKKLSSPIKILALDPGVINFGVGLFEFDGLLLKPLRYQQLSNEGLNVKDPITAVTAAWQVYNFLNGDKLDVFAFEHNQYVDTTIIYLIGASLFISSLSRRGLKIKRYTTQSVKFACLGHRGAHYDVKKANGRREFSKEKKRVLMKREMVAWVNKTFGTDFDEDYERDVADCFAVAHTYCKKELGAF